MIHRTLAAAAAATLLVVATAQAGVQIGDAGRVLLGVPAVFADNRTRVRVDADNRTRVRVDMDVEFLGIHGYWARAAVTGGR